MPLPYFIVQSLSCVWLFSTPWAAAHQESLSFTIPHSMLKLMTIDLMMPSNHLILCRPLLLPPSIFPGIRVFSNESGLCFRWPKYWSFSFSISPSNEYSGLISFRIDWLDPFWSHWFSLLHKTRSWGIWVKKQFQRILLILLGCLGAATKIITLLYYVNSV